MRSRSLHVLASFALAVAACTGSSSTPGATTLGDATFPTDTGPTDAGPAQADTGDDAGADVSLTPDTSSPDTSASDVSGSDTVDPIDAPDTGPLDMDAGSIEDTAADVSGPDSSSPDSSSPDSSSPDSSSPDTGPGNGPPDGPHLALRLSSAVVETSAHGGKLAITCVYIDKDGKSLPDPGDLLIAVAAKGASKGAEGWSFPTAGRFVVSCTSAKLKMAHSVDVLVAGKGLDPALSRMAAHLSRSAGQEQIILDTAKSGDKAAQKKALATFDVAGKEMVAGFADNAHALIPHPNGMPSLDKLKAKGLKPGPDDAKWVAALGEVKGALSKMKLAIAAVDPKKPTAAHLAGLQVADKALVAARAQLAGLKPSPLAVYTHLGAVDQLVGAQLVEVVQAHHAMLSKAFHFAATAPPPPPCQGCFSLVGVMVSIGIQHVLSSIPSYTGLLKDMGWAIGEMVLTLVIKDVIDDKFPPENGGPSIVAIVAGSAVAVTPGLPLSIMADHFGGKPGQCGVVFITPMVSKTIIDTVKLIVGGIPSFKNLKSKGAWEAAKAIKGGIDQLKAFVALTKDAIPTLAENGVVTMWAQSGSGFSDTAGIIKLGVTPKKANCGWLPKPGILLPICRHTGRGASFTVTVIGKSC